MKDEEIAALDLGSLADPEGAWLFAWVTPIMLDRFWTKILPAWKAQGWSFSSRGFLWVKTNADRSFSHGTGHAKIPRIATCSGSGGQSGDEA
jgi:N6-adenosine-specific RNA methylase IME4